VLRVGFQGEAAQHPGPASEPQWQQRGGDKNEALVGAPASPRSPCLCIAVLRLAWL
jgi:hypothetical protein